jgi:hypothetical protein
VDRELRRRALGGAARTSGGQLLEQALQGREPGARHAEMLLAREHAQVDPCVGDHHHHGVEPGLIARQAGRPAEREPAARTVEPAIDRVAEVHALAGQELDPARRRFAEPRDPSPQADVEHVREHRDRAAVLEPERDPIAEPEGLALVGEHAHPARADRDEVHRDGGGRDSLIGGQRLQPVRGGEVLEVRHRVAEALGVGRRREQRTERVADLELCVLHAQLGDHVALVGPRRAHPRSALQRVLDRRPGGVVGDDPHGEALEGVRDRDRHGVLRQRARLAAPGDVARPAVHRRHLVDRQLGEQRVGLDPGRADRHHAIDVADRDAEHAAGLEDRLAAVHADAERAGAGRVERERHARDRALDLGAMHHQPTAQRAADRSPRHARGADLREDLGERERHRADPAARRQVESERALRIRGRHGRRARHLGLTARGDAHRV